MEHLFAVQYAYLIPLLPLLGAVVAGFFGARFLKGQSHWPIWLGVGASAVISFTLLFGMLKLTHHGDGHGAGHAAAPATHADAHASAHAAPGFAVGQPNPQAGEPDPIGYVRTIYNWIEAGDPAKAGTSDYFLVRLGYLFDPLSAVMLCVVCGIGFFITVFAAGYMKGEAGYFRFFAYLGLFIFMMTNLVMGENLIMLYLGWEGVGLCSYLLIGYYYDKPAAREAAKKAFLVNRVGDFGFALGIMLSFAAFGTVSYFGETGQYGGLLDQAAAMPGQLTAFQNMALDWIPFLLMVGAFGKSAQFPLYVWLPDAMEGPTPVSALIHAATMVTAGVYMIARCSTLFVANEAAMVTIAVVGAFTALFAGSIALRQYDLKKVFAYSTVSQLGFMFVGVGVLAPVAGVFHLVTHAFFKALLFLSSGVVMHAMAGELDMRKMSGLKKVLPQTRLVMLIGCAALAGFPLLSGFWSKDEIIHAAHHKSTLLYAVLTLTAFMTAYYTFRLYFRVFEGPLVVPPAPAGGHGHGHSTGGHETPHQKDQNVDTHLAHDTAHHGGAAHGHGGGHGDHGHHNHEPAVMMIPLYVLAVGALLAGLLNLPFSAGVPAHWFGHFLGQSPSFAQGFHKASAFYGVTHPDHPVEPTLMGQNANENTPAFTVMPLVIGGAVAIAGILVAYLFHLKDRARADRLARSLGGVTNAIDNKYWVDEIYQNGIVEPLRAFGRFLFAVDRYLVDGIVGFVSFVPQVFGFLLKFFVQRGYLQGYAAAMLFGLAVILILVFL